MRKYAVLLIVANVIWAGSYAVMKWGLADIQPLSLVFYRMFASAILLWGTILLFYRGELSKLNRSFFFRILLVTALDLIHHTGLCGGVKLSHATDASLIISMEPVFLFFLATIILREELTARHVISLILAMIGFIALSNFASLSSVHGIAILGNVIILFAVISEAGFSIFFKPLTKFHSPILLMAMVTLIQSIILAPIAYSADPGLFTPILTTKNIIVVGYLALFCTVFGYTMWLLIMSKIPVNIMAISLFMQPVLGPMIAGLTLGEKLGTRIFIGGAFIIGALYVVSFGKTMLPAIVVDEGAKQSK